MCPGDVKGRSVGMRGSAGRADAGGAAAGHGAGRRPVAILLLAVLAAVIAAVAAAWSGGAQLVVQNGAGYDAFMGTIESAAPNRDRTVIDVQRLLKLPDSTANPHLWYDPATMPKVAAAIAAALTAIQPAHAGYFAANA